MLKFLGMLPQVLSLGKQNQSFLGAGWVVGLLRLTPQRYKRKLALMVLSWSPHYFYRHIDPAYLYLSNAEFYEKEFERNKSSREKICSYVLLPYLDKTQAVLDYGCGPGFLANSVSRYVRKVYGIDLSPGVLECARILNGAPNISFLPTIQMNEIDDASIDLVYSFAVVQHVTDAILEEILSTMHGKLRKGGVLLIHVILEGDNWGTEQNWRQDKSLMGRLKWKYGLHCFKRSKADLLRTLETAGYTSVVIQKMDELCPEAFDDICTQHLVRAVA